MATKKQPVLAINMTLSTLATTVSRTTFLNLEEKYGCGKVFCLIPRSNSDCGASGVSDAFNAANLVMDLHFIYITLH